MKRFLPIIILFILLQSCKEGIPKEIIQPDRMEKILFDIHVVDGYLGTLTDKDTTKIIASSYYNGIYKKFKIDSALLSKSMDYYYSHPVILNEIYNKVDKVFKLENEKFDKTILTDEQLNNVNNLSLVVIINLPPKVSGSTISVNPFDFNLSLSRL